MGAKINSKLAAQHLTEHGRPTEKSSLDTMRSIGGGPPFYRSGKYILYDTDDLDVFAASSPMTKYNSTSEYPLELRNKRKKPDDESDSGARPNDGGE